MRSLGYYTGAVFQVYDPAYGVPIGSGGRYDELLAGFGRPLPAVGFALGVERVHIALTGEERGRRRQTVSELRIAVPRGALFEDTLDLLDRLGLDTREVRDNDRKLLFEEAGIITMRPSDVPTYVEAGAADLGITGKDVLLEQSEREIYELVDLGYGECTMVLATVAGEDRAAEALRRLGVVRIATKYPRIAARYFLETGRQAEIVEVKGSVELAPLTGLVEGIVDLTATGTTLRENGLVVREEIAHCTARLIANPVAHKLRAARSTRCWSGSMRCERIALTGDPAAARKRSCARSSRRPSRSAPTWPRSSRGSAPRATPRVLSTTRARSTPAAPTRSSSASPTTSSTPPPTGCDPDVRARARARDCQRRGRRGRACPP